MPGQAPDQFVILGASRGLGAALMDAALHAGGRQVLGVSRTPLERVSRHGDWERTKRAGYRRADLGDPACLPVLRDIAASLLPEPLVLVFNASLIQTEVDEQGQIDFKVFQEVSRVGVLGLGHALDAFWPHLHAHGGVLVGISSINAVRPPVFWPYLAYGPTKAYLEAALRGLDLLEGRAATLMVRLGKIGNAKAGKITSLVHPTYADTAEKIVRASLKPGPPRLMVYPGWYSLLYGSLTQIVPDRIFNGILGKIIRHQP